MKLSELILECVKQGYSLHIEPDPSFRNVVFLSLRYRDLRIDYRHSLRDFELNHDKEAMLSITLERLKRAIKIERSKKELQTLIGNETSLGKEGD